MQKLRFAASGLSSAHGDNNDNDDNPAVYTKQKILDELPDNVIIYSGNKTPGPKPGSIPRGIFTDLDYCSPGYKLRAMPTPSAADLFSPRPLPELSWGRRAMKPPRVPNQEHRPGHGKRVREADPGISQTKRRKFAAD